MRIKTSTLLATAVAIYHASWEIGERPATSFERLCPHAKDMYARMAKAAAEAIDRDYPLTRITANPDAAEDKSLGANQNQSKG